MLPYAILSRYLLWCNKHILLMSIPVPRQGLKRFLRKLFMAATKAKSKTRIPELKIVLDSNTIYNQSAHYILTKEIYELIKVSIKYHDLKITWYLPETVRHERQYQMLN